MGGVAWQTIKDFFFFFNYYIHVNIVYSFWIILLLFFFLYILHWLELKLMSDLDIVIAVDLAQFFVCWIFKNNWPI